MSKLVFCGKAHTTLCRTLAQFNKVETLSSAISSAENEEDEESKDDAMKLMVPIPEELKGEIANGENEMTPIFKACAHVKIQDSHIISSGGFKKWSYYA